MSTLEEMARVLLSDREDFSPRITTNEVRKVATIPQDESEALTKRVFVLTMVGAVLFLLLVIFMATL